MIDPQQMIHDLNEAYEAHIRENGDPGERTLDDILENIDMVNEEMNDPNSQFSTSDLSNILNHLKKERVCYLNSFD